MLKPGATSAVTLYLSTERHGEDFLREQTEPGLPDKFRKPPGKELSTITSIT
jgi:hypothetical protein